MCALYDQLKIMFCIIFWQRFVTANQVSPSQFRILFLFNMEFTFVQLANRQQYNVFSTKLSKFFLGVNGMYDISEKLAAVVQAARIAHGLTQEELAETIGVTGKSISNIERGVANPEFESIYLLFRFLGIDANAIFYPERSDVDTMLNQFQRILAGCTGDELEMLLSINREILIHTRRMDEVGEVETV